MSNLILPRRFTSQPQQPVELLDEYKLGSFYLPAIHKLGTTSNNIASTTASPTIEGDSTGLCLITNNAQESVYSLATERQKRFPLTLIWHGSLLGNAISDSSIFGITYDGSNSSPYVIAEIKRAPGADQTKVLLQLNDGSTYRSVTLTIGSYTGPITFVANLQKTYQVIYACKQGEILSAYGSWTATPISTATSRFEIGDSLNATRHPNAAHALAATIPFVPPQDVIYSWLRNPYSIFKPRRHVLYFGGTATPITISCTTGNAVAAGTTASVSQAITLASSVGNAVAAGAAASVSQAITISAAAGNATAAGTTASVTQAVTIQTTAGNAVAAGITAGISLSGAIDIICTVGGATAAGIAAQVAQGIVIGCQVGDALADGIQSSITVTGTLTDSQKIDLILDILQNKQVLDPVTGFYTLYADDGVTVLYTAAAWEDTAGTIPYSGGCVRRLDAMQ